MKSMIGAKPQRRGKPYKPEGSSMQVVMETDSQSSLQPLELEMSMGASTGAATVTSDVAASSLTTIDITSNATNTTTATTTTSTAIAVGGGDNNNNNNNGNTTTAVKVATVRRDHCGTGPFDRYWLNLDCCGLICAAFTWLLHVYGVHTICFILIPPWMSYRTPLSSSDSAASLAETTSRALLQQQSDEVGGSLHDETSPEAAAAAALGAMATETVRHLSAWGVLHTTVFTVIAILAVVSHIKAMTTDPGAVPPDATPVPDTTNSSNDPTDTPPVRRLCRRCKAFKPARAHHCSVCRRCIIKMDHHCPWVNNCVGIGNHKYFLLFIFYTFISCIYALLLILVRFTTCVGEHYQQHRQTLALAVAHHHRHRVHHSIFANGTTCLDDPAQLLNIFGLLVEALLFGMFTSCMMFDQWDVIYSKMTHIDRLKGADISGSLPGVAEVFGVGRRGVDTRFRPDWLSPFSRVCFPPSVRDEVMGFCQPVPRHLWKHNSTVSVGRPPSSIPPPPPPLPVAVDPETLRPLVHSGAHNHMNHPAAPRHL